MQRWTISGVFTLCGLLTASAAAAQAPAAQAPAAQAPAAQAPVEAPAVQHVPINEAIAGDAVVLRFVVRVPDEAGRIAVRCSSMRTEARELQRVAQLAGPDYQVELPSACVALPGLRYYAVLLVADGSERPLFASATAPHLVRVTYSQERESELRRLRARGWQRSRVLLLAEGVDFGTRKTASGADLAIATTDSKRAMPTRSISGSRRSR